MFRGIGNVMRHFGRKLLSWMIVLAMTLSCLAAVYAEEETETEIESIAEEEETEVIEEPETEPAVEPETEEAAEPETEPAAEPETEEAAEPETEAAPEPETEPATEAAPEPGTEEAAEPETETKEEGEPVAVPETEQLIETLGNAVERVDELELAGRTCYMYVPQSDRVGRFLGFAPMFMVLGDGPFTAESVLETAHEKGFTELAERDGICMLFVNPIESWDSEADNAAEAELMAAYWDTYASMPGLVFVDGKAVRTNAETGEQTIVYPGSLHGTQIYGEGKGADFIARNWLKNNAFKANYGPQEGFEGFCPPCGVALFNPTELTVNTEDGPEIPLAIVNGPENVQEVADSYNRGSVSYELVRRPEATGFEADLVVKLYDDVVAAYHFAQTAFRKSPQYTISGIREYNGKRTVSTGSTLEYYGYIPEDLELTEGSVPLVMYFHGGGGEGEAMLDWTDWVKVGKEKGFAVLSVDQHYAYTSEEVIELLDMLIADNPWIDTTRIYATGFSMGGGKTWNLAIKFPERLAGAIPTAAGWMSEGGAGWGEPMDESIIKEGIIMPVFYIGGGVSFLPEFPAAEPTNVNAVIKALWKMNNLGDYEFDETCGSRWGALPDETEALQNFDNVGVIQQLVIDRFASPDGCIYTCLCTDRNMAHNQSGKNAHVAWEWISRFSRAADGSIVVEEK